MSSGASLERTGSSRLSARMSSRMSSARLSSRLSSRNTSNRLPSGDIAILDTWLKDFVSRQGQGAGAGDGAGGLTAGQLGAAAAPGLRDSGMSNLAAAGWESNERKRKRTSSLRNSQLSACLYEDADYRSIYEAFGRSEYPSFGFSFLDATNDIVNDTAAASAAPAAAPAVAVAGVDPAIVGAIPKSGPPVAPVVPVDPGPRDPHTNGVHEVPGAAPAMSGFRGFPALRTRTYNDGLGLGYDGGHPHGRSTSFGTPRRVAQPDLPVPKVPAAVSIDPDEPPQVTNSWSDLERNFSRGRSLEPFRSGPTDNPSDFEDQLEHMTIHPEPVSVELGDLQADWTNTLPERQKSAPSGRRFLLPPSEAAKKNIVLADGAKPKTPATGVTFNAFVESLGQVREPGRSFFQNLNGARTEQMPRNASAPLSVEVSPVSGDSPHGSNDLVHASLAANGISAATIAQMNLPPSNRKIKVKRYKSLEPSRHCHVCSRPDDSVDVMVCSNLNSGTCRKIVCEKCFERYKWDFADTKTKAMEWLCTHCRNVCPEKACCKKYERTNLARHWKAKLRKTNNIALKN